MIKLKRIDMTTPSIVDVMLSLYEETQQCVHYTEWLAFNKISAINSSLKNIVSIPVLFNVGKWDYWNYLRSSSSLSENKQAIMAQDHLSYWERYYINKLLTTGVVYKVGDELMMMSNFSKFILSTSSSIVNKYGVVALREVMLQVQNTELQLMNAIQDVSLDKTILASTHYSCGVQLSVDTIEQRVEQANAFSRYVCQFETEQIQSQVDGFHLLSRLNKKLAESAKPFQSVLPCSSELLTDLAYNANYTVGNLCWNNIHYTAEVKNRKLVFYSTLIELLNEKQGAVTFDKKIFTSGASKQILDRIFELTMKAQNSPMVVDEYLDKLVRKQVALNQPRLW